MSRALTLQPKFQAEFFTSRALRLLPFLLSGFFRKVLAEKRNLEICRVCAVSTLAIITSEPPAPACKRKFKKINVVFF